MWQKEFLLFYICVNYGPYTLYRISEVAEMRECGSNPQQTWAKRGGGAVVPLSRGLDPWLTQCGLGRGLLPYDVESSSMQPLGHNRHGPKTGVPLLKRAELAPHLTTSFLRGWLTQSRLGLGLGLPPYQVDFSPSNRFATTDMGRKLRAVPFRGGERITI